MDSTIGESVVAESVRAMKHQWTSLEDGKLVESLYEMYAMGNWKCDTGFKPRYLNELEKMMKEKLPGCGLKATPHIESRVKTLKRQTMAIAEMFTNGSGFAWNDELHMVTCEKGVYDLWVKSHPGAKGLRNKQFPHYDTLLEIYGKDRANGKAATTPAGAEEELENGSTNETEANIDGIEDMEFPATQSSLTLPTSTPSNKRQRKGTDGWSRGVLEVSSSINKLVDGTMIYLDKIGTALVEESANSKMVANELQKIDGLTLFDILAAGKIIIGDTSMSTIFLSLPDDKRKEMVFEVLKN